MQILSGRETAIVPLPATAITAVLFWITMQDSSSPGRIFVYVVVTAPRPGIVPSPLKRTHRAGDWTPAGQKDWSKR